MPPPNTPEDGGSSAGGRPLPWRVPGPWVLDNLPRRPRTVRINPEVQDTPPNPATMRTRRPSVVYYSSRSPSPVTRTRRSHGSAEPSGSTSPPSHSTSRSHSPDAERIDWQDLEYTSTVDENLVCPICRTPFFRPHTTKSCGHTFCLSCLDQALSIREACPICRHDCRARAPCPRIVGAQLDKLEVKCPNKLCKWIGMRGSLEHHFEQCNYTLVACPERRCRKKVIRRDADQPCLHFSGPCFFCKEPIETAQLEDHYETACPKYIYTCASCDSSVVRHDKDNHNRACLAMEVECAYTSSGCNFKCPRSDISSHEEDCSFGVFKRLENRYKEEMDKARDRLTKQMEQTLARKEQQLKAQMEHSLTSMLHSVEDQVVQHITERLERRFPNTSYTGERGAFPRFPSPGSTFATDGSRSSPTLGTEGVEGGDHCAHCDARDEYMFSMFADIESRISNLAKTMTDQDARHSVMILNEVMPLKEQLAEARSQQGVVGMHVRWLMDIQRQKRANDRQSLNGAAAAAAAAVSNLTGASASRAGSSVNGEAVDGPQTARRMSERMNPPRL